MTAAPDDGCAQPIPRREILRDAATGRGRQTPPPFNTEDLRGQDCLFAIASDGLLGTGTEHFDGFSVWCDRRQMAKGVFEGAQLLWHSNG